MIQAIGFETSIFCDGNEISRGIFDSFLYYYDDDKRVMLTCFHGSVDIIKMNLIFMVLWEDYIALFCGTTHGIFFLSYYV